MILVDITGDLGNQLFQYATAKSLSADKNTNLLLNLDYFKDETLNNKAHICQLDYFNINMDNQIDKIELDNISDIHIINETLPSNDFIKYINLNKNVKNIYLKGNWQNEKYFKHNENLIKEQLKISTAPTSKNREILDEILVSNSVCLLFRHLEEFDSYSLAYEGICSEDYYRKSINLVTKMVNNPTFFIFTNDITWVEDNVKMDYPTVPIELNKPSQSYEDLRLMSSCENFILTNDNLNWWSAWLSNHKNKTIIAPTPWLNSFTNQNILCPNWIHIKSTNQHIFDTHNSKIYELITQKDFEKLNCENIIEENGKYGIKLNIEEDFAKIELALNEPNSLIMELKLFSKNKGLLKIDYGPNKDIILGYNKGHSLRYMQLHNSDLKNKKLIIKAYDSDLIIEHITISSFKPNFKLII